MKHRGMNGNVNRVTDRVSNVNTHRDYTLKSREPGRKNPTRTKTSRSNMSPLYETWSLEVWLSTMCIVVTSFTLSHFPPLSRTCAVIFTILQSSFNYTRVEQHDSLWDCNIPLFILTSNDPLHNIYIIYYIFMYISHTTYITLTYNITYNIRYM